MNGISPHSSSLSFPCSMSSSPLALESVLQSGSSSSSSLSSPTASSIASSSSQFWEGTKYKHLSAQLKTEHPNKKVCNVYCHIMGLGDGSGWHNLHQSLHQEDLHHQRPHPHQMTLLRAHKCKQIHKLRRQNSFHYTNANPPHEKVVRGKKKKSPPCFQMFIHFMREVADICILKP